MNKKILLLGAGELGKEFVISAQRLACHVIAVDKYAGAPAMQVADEAEIIDMLDGVALQKVVDKHRPDFIVPEIEAIRTEKLAKFEADGIKVIPTAEATYLTMNRDAIRDLAANELGLKTAAFSYAAGFEELKAECKKIGFPCVVKPVMSSSGKGQSLVKGHAGIQKAWEAACSGMRGDKKKVIVEEFIDFDSEITLLTIKQWSGPTRFVKPIGHRQERGDYQESWLPAKIGPRKLEKAQKMAKKITDRLGGAGLFGVEFFITKKDVYFSELSPRPHDTGMVTLYSQNLSEFDLHLRAILGLPIPQLNYYSPAASAVILAPKDSTRAPSYQGLEKAQKLGGVDIRLFGKPSMRKYRRMGVALAQAASVKKARQLATKAARAVKVGEQ